MTEIPFHDKKECRKCHQEFPATAEYFCVARRNRDGLHTRCHACRREDKRAAWARDADVINEQRRSDPEKRLRQFQAWVAKHPDYSVQWYARHQDEVLTRAQRRYDADPVKYRARGREAFAVRKTRIAALPNLLTDGQKQEALDYWHGYCAVCGAAPGEDGKALAHDHWIALADPSCPGTVAWNSVPLCDGRNGCNTRKHDQDPWVFLVRYFTPDIIAAQQKLREIATFLRQRRARYEHAAA